MGVCVSQVGVRCLKLVSVCQSGGERISTATFFKAVSVNRF